MYAIMHNNLNFLNFLQEKHSSARNGEKIEQDASGRIMCSSFNGHGSTGG